MVVLASFLPVSLLDATQEKHWIVMEDLCCEVQSSFKDGNLRSSQNQARIATARQREFSEHRAERLAKDTAIHAVGRRLPLFSCFSEPRDDAFRFDNSRNDHNYYSVVLIRDISVPCSHCGARKFPAETSGMCCSIDIVTRALLKTSPQHPLNDLLEGIIYPILEVS